MKHTLLIVFFVVAGLILYYMREEIFGPRRYSWSGILRSVSGKGEQEPFRPPSGLYGKASKDAEPFGVSPGTFEQLQSTHVPAYKVVYM